MHKNYYILTLLGSFIGGVNASVLTFDVTGISNHQSISQNYGDNITATTMGSFSYGATEGFTPNITVAYGDSDPALWIAGYGNLTNVLIEDADNTGILTVILTADPGYEVVLHEFDVAGFDTVFATAPTIDLVDVSNTSSSIFNLADALISDTTSTHFDFTPTLQSSQLTITIDARNLGGLNDDIAIDNIVFSQVAVPEPSSTFLLGLVSLSVALRRSRS